MKRVPPYLPFRTFNNFLAELAKDALPQRIDRPLLAQMSHSLQSQMLSACRYLGLITDEGKPTDDLRRLLQASGDSHKEIWEKIVRRSYDSLFQLGLENATTQELVVVFWKEGLRSQDTNRKALNFFCLAARAAGISISPHIRPYAGRRKSAGRGAQGSALKLLSFPSQRMSAIKNESSDWDLIWSKFPKFNPSWSENEIRNWLDVLEKLLQIRKNVDSNKERTISA